MKKCVRRAVFTLLLASFSASFFISCSSSRLNDQIKFGIWASEKDLWDEAIFRWKKALALDPNSVAAHNNLAVAYEKKGFFEEALKEYEFTLKLAPNNTYVKSNYQNCKENIQPAKKDAKDKDEKK
jgi:Tfp pilus assembly protein PilF